MANLSGADLWNANLSGIHLTHANLSGADCWFAKFSGAVLRGTNLSGASLSEANLSGAELIEANLSGANLFSANLTKADLLRTDLFEADLTVADLSEADFSETTLTNAKLRDANLTKTNLTGVKGLRLDGNLIRETRFSPNINEPWHNIRREYTGSKFFFHLLLLVIFFGSMGLRVAMWMGVNKGQAVVVQAAERLDAAAAKSAVTNPDLAAAMNATAQELAKVSQTFTDTSHAYPIWQVLLGLDRGWGPCSLAILLLLYNNGRVLLTYNVGAMREEEERSSITPYWKDYRRAWSIHHYAMRWLKLIALAAFAYHAYFWLTATVVLPG